MHKFIKKMKKSWEINSQMYPDHIGITGRRPVDSEFMAVIDDLSRKIDVNSQRFNKILDVGCSNGYLMKSLNPNADLIIGLDYCLHSLQNGKKVSPNMVFVQSEINELPFAHRSFDRILCYNMFHYLPSVEIGLLVTENLYHLLTPGGELVIGDIFTREHKHQIPEEFVHHWNDPSRPFLHRMENWLFMPIEKMRERICKLGADSKILPQRGDLRCKGYRFDLWARKWKEDQ